ncbi:hypothetical protein D3C87_2089850 [compost metagenome]
MAGATERGDLARLDFCLLDAAANDIARIRPEFVEIAFHVPRAWHAAMSLRQRSGDFIAGAIEDHRFDNGVAGVEPQ